MNLYESVNKNLNEGIDYNKIDIKTLFKMISEYNWIAHLIGKTELDIKVTFGSETHIFTKYEDLEKELKDYYIDEVSGYILRAYGVLEDGQFIINYKGAGNYDEEVVLSLVDRN